MAKRYKLGEGWEPIWDADTSRADAFVADLVAVCKKHGMVIIPSPESTGWPAAPGSKDRANTTFMVVDYAEDEVREIEAAADCLAPSPHTA